LEDVKREEELIKKAKAGLLVEKVKKEAPAKGSGIRKFNVFVDGEYFEVEVEEVGGVPSAVTVAPATQPTPVAKPKPVVAPPPPPPPAPTPSAPPKPKAAAPTTGVAIEAPMPGMVVRYEVEEGAQVKEGDVILVLEAMKMENTITTPISGTVKKINFKPGDSVQKGDVLAIIE